jgi:hypothetical protein
VSLNAEHQPLLRAGLAWLEREAQARYGRPFGELTEAEQEAILKPLSDAVDREAREVQRGRFRTEGTQAVYYVPITDKAPPPRPQVAAPTLDADDPRMPVRFFRLVKNLTADGYYTSRVGLLDELGYRGNTFLAAFPACSVPEQ